MDSDSTSSLDDPRRWYAQRLNTHTSEANSLTEWKRQVSRSRLGIVAVWLVLLVLGLNGYLTAGVGWGLAAFAFFILIVLATIDERLGDRLKLKNEQAAIARVQLARLDRAWKQIPEIPVTAPEEASNVSRDLDLFGHASLFQLLCRANTPTGIALLRDWLVTSASPDVVGQRNLASATLASMREFREELDWRGRLLHSSPSGPAAFVEWAEGEQWLEQRRWLKWSSRLLVAAGVLSVIAGVTGILPEVTVVTICVGIALANLLVSVLLTGAVHDIFEKVDSRQHDVQHYRELIELFDQVPREPELLAALHQKIGANSHAPQAALKSLARIMRFAQMRHSAVLGILHLGLQLIFLIDFHVLAVLESWQRKHGREVRPWFDAVGELEAISSLASLVHDNPTWTFPSVDPTQTTLQATALGHPLLASPVVNDVEVGPKGTFLLVTGSNMSGKSTLLRAIGLNAILAQAGAPVSAASLALPPVEVATSMRIQDSLEDGISFFMAELKRLKEIVDQAEELAANNRTQLFLLDEILQGTNSAERHIAVAKVASQLTESGAMGAISTHDLELASNPELTASCQSVHFKESFTADGQMTFDYRMRAGVATTTNALKLLELVGIRDKLDARS